MLDIKFVRDNIDKVKKAAKDKRIDLDFDLLLDLDDKRRSLLSEIETLRATKNNFSKEIIALSNEDKKVKILEMQEVDSRQKELEVSLRHIEEEYNNLMLLVPNIPSSETPIGPDESSNLPWAYWSPILGQVDPKDNEKVKEVPTKFTFDIKDHIELGKNLDLIDTEKGVNTSGFRGYYLKNEAVLMQMGLLWLALRKLQEHGFTLFIPPVLIREFALLGSGHFPLGRDEVYQVGNSSAIKDNVSKEPVYLAGTSEPSLLAYYANTVLEEKDLPLKLCGITSCYRSEVGSYGKDTKGIYRVHEFMKVEQVIICKADINEADSWLEKLREISEEILQSLKLPYRVLNIATGDMGAGKYKMYDIETWMPSKNAFGETHSDSNLTDWQARRLGIRYKDSTGNIRHAFTLNNTAIASPRILIPILENYQQEDGSVIVPEVLKPYVGKDVLKPSK